MKSSVTQRFIRKRVNCTCCLFIPNTAARVSGVRCSALHTGHYAIPAAAKRFSTRMNRTEGLCPSMKQPDIAPMAAYASLTFAAYTFVRPG